MRIGGDSQAHAGRLWCVAIRSFIGGVFSSACSLLEEIAGLLLALGQKRGFSTNGAAPFTTEESRAKESIRDIAAKAFSVASDPRLIPRKWWLSDVSRSILSLSEQTEGTLLRLSYGAAETQEKRRKDVRGRKDA